MYYMIYTNNKNKNQYKVVINILPMHIFDALILLLALKNGQLVMANDMLTY